MGSESPGNSLEESPAIAVLDRFIAGLQVTTILEDPLLVDLLDPWIRLFSPEGDDDATPAAFTVRYSAVEDGELPVEPPRGKPLVEYLYVSGWADGERLLFRGTDGSIMTVDDLGIARARVPRSALAGPPWVVRDLFNAAITTFLRTRGRYPLHAAAVRGPAGEGVLIVGPPMAGKTSLSLNFLRRGWSWIADDKVIVRRSENGVSASGLFRHSNVDPWLISYFGELETIASCPPLYPHSDKRGVHLETIYGDMKQNAMAPRWIFFPEVVDLGATTVKGLDERAAFFELLRQLPLVNEPRSSKAALKLIADLARGAKAFRIRMGRDLLEDPAVLPALLSPFGLAVGPLARRT